MNRVAKEIRDLGAQFGFEYEDEGRGHPKLVHPDKGVPTVSVPRTPSDHRWKYNLRSTLRQALSQAKNGGSANPDGMLVCPHCGVPGFETPQSLGAHKNKCAENPGIKENCQHCGRVLVGKAARASHEASCYSNPDSKVKVPCRYCRTEYRRTGVKRHEYSCKENPKNIRAAKRRAEQAEEATERDAERRDRIDAEERQKAAEAEATKLSEKLGQKEPEHVEEAPAPKRRRRPTKEEGDLRAVVRRYEKETELREVLLSLAKDLAAIDPADGVALMLGKSEDAISAALELVLEVAARQDGGPG